MMKHTGVSDGRIELFLVLTCLLGYSEWVKYLILFLVVAITSLAAFSVGSTQAGPTITSESASSSLVCPPCPETNPKEAECPAPRSNATRLLPTKAPDCPRETILAARLGECEEQLKDSARAQLSHLTPHATEVEVPEQRVVPFPEDYPAQEQQQDILNSVRRILGEESIEAIDCSEYPCIAYIELEAELEALHGKRWAEEFLGKLRNDDLGTGGMVIHPKLGTRQAGIAIATNPKIPIDRLAPRISQRHIDYFGLPENEDPENED